jgi:serine/threonine protein kinase
LEEVKTPKIKFRKLETYFESTNPYMAPELLENVPYCGKEIDLWSIGILLFCMRTGTCPFIKCSKVDKTFQLF